MQSIFKMHPLYFVEGHTIDEVIQELKGMEKISFTILVKTHLMLHHWTFVLISRPSDTEGILEAIDLCRLARTIPLDESGANKAEKIGEMYSTIAVFRSLLDFKRRQIEFMVNKSFKKDFCQVSILILLAEGPKSQSEIGESFFLNPRMVTKILGTMESCAMGITRYKQGNDYYVRLT